MAQDYISGIQQIGIGVKDAPQALNLYARLFGMDALVFDDVSEASLMARYTGGTVYRRHAILAMNLQGGGGFELWQFKNRIPGFPSIPPRYGDTGIYAAKIKAADINQAYQNFQSQKYISLSPMQQDNRGQPHFWVRDENNNVFNVVQCAGWFHNQEKKTGGVCGAVIGVTDMERSVLFYMDLLNLSKIASDETALLDSGPDPMRQHYRKVLLQKNANGKGAFGKLLGSMEIELVQCLDRKPQRIYHQRYWGDCGFIHLCLDVYNMDGLKEYLLQKNYSFTIDSQSSFGMGKATGRFCYIEDPDGNLIELVETHKVPLIKKLGLYLNLKKRSLEKPLPDWCIRLLALNKVKP